LAIRKIRRGEGTLWWGVDFNCIMAGTLREGLISDERGWREGKALGRQHNTTRENSLHRNFDYNYNYLLIVTPFLGLRLPFLRPSSQMIQKIVNTSTQVFHEAVESESACAAQASLQRDITGGFGLRLPRSR
jgi:hypothetical protein